MSSDTWDSSSPLMILIVSVIAPKLLVLSMTRYPFPDARALFERVISNFPPERARTLWERWARYEYQYGDLEAALKLERRMTEVYPAGASVLHIHLPPPTNIYLKDPPIKRLAQRHIYLGTDAIADRDLGFAVARRSGGNSVGRTETTQSVLTSSQNTAPPPKRPASPDYRKRDDGRAGDFAGGHKRPRGSSPGRGPDRDRDRWEVPRRRFSPPPGRGGGGREPPSREDEKPRPNLPAILTHFLGDLPTPSSFDGNYITLPIISVDLCAFRSCFPHGRSYALVPKRGDS